MLNGKERERETERNLFWFIAFSLGKARAQRASESNQSSSLSWVQNEQKHRKKIVKTTMITRNAESIFLGGWTTIYSNMRAVIRLHAYEMTKI